MKAKMILLLFVMGVILGGCSVKFNKDILLDDTKTIIKYSPYQKMFMDLIILNITYFYQKMTIKKLVKNL